MNIVDFVKKFGNLTFKQRPFDEVDSIVLCQLSYLNWRWIIPSIHANKRGLTIDKILKSGLDDKLCASTLSPRKNKKLLKALRGQKRYHHIVVSDIWNVFDEESENQFFALTFILPNRNIYICYRGTDITLVGWKEDLNMSYDLLILSHKEAVEYFKFIMLKHPRSHFYLGGHSKGGNLSVFTSFVMDKKYVKNLIKVYSHDGPGFLSPTFCRNDEYKEYVENRIEKTVPYHSIIGMLLYTSFDTKIIKASSFYIFQHDLFNCHINPKTGGLYYLKDRSKQSKIREKTFKEWIVSLSKEDKIFIVNFIYDILGRENYTVLQLFSKCFDILRRIFKVQKTLTKHQQELIKYTIKYFINMYKTLFTHR